MPSEARLELTAAALSPIKVAVQPKHSRDQDRKEYHQCDPSSILPGHLEGRTNDASWPAGTTFPQAIKSEHRASVCVNLPDRLS